MFVNLENQATYFGTIDDVVSRYPWREPIDIATIRLQMITAAIYDKKLLINDGYLIANPELLSELAHPNVSLLGSMLISGQAWLFTRGGTSIAAGIEAQAAGVNTHAELVSSPSWPATRDNLEALGRYTSEDAVIWPADKNMGLAFYLLMRDLHDGLAERSEDPQAGLWSNFHRVFARFDKDLDRPGYYGARSVWERAAWTEIAECEVSPFALMATAPADREKTFPGYEQVRQLMAIANQVYHYAYAAAAGHALALTDRASSQIGVASGFSFVHPGLTEIAPAPTPLQDERTGALSRLSLSLPANIRFKDKFSDIASIELKSDCRTARQHYLHELRNVWNGADDLSAAESARNQYRSELAKVLQPMIEDKFVEFVGKALFTPVTFALGKAVPVIGGLLGYVIGVDRRQRKMVERLMTRRVETALDENAIHAIQSGKPIPAMNNGDLYFGPLRDEGAQKLMKAVDMPKP
jgi:hypothetical protein